MELVADLLKVILPAALILWAMYLAINAFIKKDLDQKKLEAQGLSDKTTLTLRLGAYERICLLLERIAPSQLLLRTSPPEISAVAYQQLLTHEIRNELSHNFSQQVYMSDEAWLTVKNAVNETISLINLAATELEPDAPAVALSKKVFEKLLQSQRNPSEVALVFIKEEARLLWAF